MCLEGVIILSYSFFPLLFYRFVADILNDCALFLELISPLFNHMFTPLLCLANVLKVTHIGLDVFCCLPYPFVANFSVL